MFARYLLMLSLLVFLLILSPICYALPQPLGEITREQIIDQYFKNKSMDSVEGLWTTTDSKYEFAIIKNTSGFEHEYDYIGVITNTSDSNWAKGEIKLLLRKTSSEKLYSAKYFIIENPKKLWGSSKKKEYGTTLNLPSKNLLEGYLPTGLYGLPVKHSLLRTYPTYDSSDSTGIVSSGTGFFITPSLVATNFHIIDNAKSIEVCYQNETKLPATVVAKDPVNDLAILRIDGLERSKPVYTGLPRDIKEGTKVFTVGFPLTSELGSRAKIGEGIVNSVTGLEDDLRMFQISIPIQPGNSGGPLYNEHGQVIGIVSSTLNNRYFLNRMGVIPQNVNYAIKINYLYNLVSMLPDDVKLSGGTSSEILDAPQIMDLAKQSVVNIIAKN